MTESYARIRLPMAEALVRFSAWIGLPELGPPVSVKWNKVVDAACENDTWRSAVAVYIYESEGWTVFEDQTGYLSAITADRWRALAGGAELVFAGYDDTIPYGQLIAVTAGQVVREFLDDEEDPKDNVNRGTLPSEKRSPIRDWIAAVGFVEGDEIVSMPDTGLLWMSGKAAE